uniref:RRP15-like protein n=1 Tax=Strigamia maritima TaxID=126957 RepID=T1JA25_STRMM
MSGHLYSRFTSRFLYCEYLLALVGKIQNKSKMAVSIGTETKKRKLSGDVENDKPYIKIDDDTESDTENNEKAVDNTCETNEETTEIGNPSWADAMQKVLRGSGPVHKLLTKAKKDSAIKIIETKKKNGFEIVDNVDGVEKVVKIDEDSQSDEEIKQKHRQTKRKLQEWEILLKKKPNVTERERERALSRIATKGVVQLFNAVKQQQVTVNEKVKKAGTERKREKIMKNVSKGDFLDLLHGKSKSVNVRDEIRKSKKTTKEVKSEGWDLFRDDFMLGAKMKDWDKANDGNDDSS